MPMTIEEVERELIGACADMSWRDTQEGMERLLTNLMWWLEAKGANSEALTISAIKNEFRFNNSSSAALNHVMVETDCVSVKDLLERWAELQKLEDDQSL